MGILFLERIGLISQDISTWCALFLNQAKLEKSHYQVQWFHVTLCFWAFAYIYEKMLVRCRHLQKPSHTRSFIPGFTGLSLTLNYKRNNYSFQEGTYEPGTVLSTLLILIYVFLINTLWDHYPPTLQTIKQRNRENKAILHSNGI